MIEQDTIKLLRECDAGVAMGICSIADVEDRVQSSNLRSTLADCKSQHCQLQEIIQNQLNRYHDSGKQPNPVAAGMSRFKTAMKLSMEESDAAIASLMTDGCNMGVKSLTRYLNQYKAAEEYSKDIAKKLIHLEQQLARDMGQYL